MQQKYGSYMRTNEPSTEELLEAIHRKSASRRISTYVGKTDHSKCYRDVSRSVEPAADPDKYMIKI